VVVLALSEKNMKPQAKNSILGVSSYSSSSLLFNSSSCK